MKAVSSVVAGVLVIALVLVSIGAVTAMFYSGLFGVSQEAQLERFLLLKDEEQVQTIASGSSLIVINAWSHPTTITYLLSVSPSGSVSLIPVDKTILPGENLTLSNVLQSGYSYAVLTAYGNEFWSSFGTTNPALQKFYVTIEENAPLGTTSPSAGTYVYPFGSKVTITATPNSGYYFAGWSGTGYRSYSGTNETGVIYVWSNITEEAYFGVEINFSETGSAGTVLSVNGTDYSSSQLPLSLRVPYGDMIDFAWLSPVYASSGVRYVWASTAGLSNQQSGSVVATQNGWINATYTTQYRLLMSANPPNGGTTTPSGTNWYAPGTSVSISETPSSGCVFVKWVGSGSGSYTGTGSSATVVMNNPINETAYFFIPKLTIYSNATATANDILELSFGGNTYYLTGEGLPYSFQVPAGATVTYSWISPVSIASGQRDIWIRTTDNFSASLGQNGSFTMPPENAEITGLYRTQYQLTMEVSPSGAGSTNPSIGSHWYNASERVPISETPNAGYAFVEWSGSGSGSYTGTSATATVAMYGPITEVAEYRIEIVAITFEASGLNASASGTVLSLTYGGSTYDLGYSQLPYSVLVPYNTTISFAYQSPVLSSGNYKWLWTSTGDTLSLSLGQSGSLKATANGTVTGNYAIEYEYIFEEQGLPDGAAWGITAEGTSYSATAPNNITVWSASTSLSYTAQSATYSGQTYRPENPSGTARPGVTVIYYQISVTGVAGMIYFYPQKLLLPLMLASAPEVEKRSTGPNEFSNKAGRL